LFTGCAPAGPKALLEGEQLIRQGRFPEAIDRLRTARRLLPDEPRVYIFLGLAEHGAGNTAAAVDAYQQALARDRDLAAARYNLGCLLLEHDNARAAVAELTTFVRLQPDSPEGWLRLGTAHLHNNDLAEAEQGFLNAARLSPDHPEALNGLGVIRFHQNRPREAADQFNKILLNHPGYSPALFNLGVIHQSHLVNLPIAFDRYRQYLNSTPNPAHAAEVERIARNLYDQIKQRPATQELVSARSPVPPPRPTPPPPAANAAAPNANATGSDTKPPPG
jgi:Flp pilus assembly protein TadD